MKGLFFAVVALLTINAYAAKPKGKVNIQKICDSMQAKVDLECAHIMCDWGIDDGTWKDLDACTSASDYAEAAQAACAGQETTLEDLVADYNRKHPKAQIKCE